MAARKATPDFSTLFDRAAAACAESQRVMSRTAETMERVPASRVASAQMRRSVGQMREVWANADAMHTVLRAEVEQVAIALRDAGIGDDAAVAAVRARIRFVLYDGGLTEQDAEPVVQRASLWVEQVYTAA